MLEAGDIVKSSEAKLYPKQLGSIEVRSKNMCLLSEEGFTWRFSSWFPAVKHVFFASEAWNELDLKPMVGNVEDIHYKA